MEEKRWNGETKLTDFEDIIKEFKTAENALFQKLQDESNKSVALHKPKSVITTKDGTQYEVMPNGSWRKIKKKGEKI